MAAQARKTKRSKR